MMLTYQQRTKVTTTKPVDNEPIHLSREMMFIEVVDRASRRGDRNRYA